MQVVASEIAPGPAFLPCCGSHQGLPAASPEQEGNARLAELLEIVRHQACPEQGRRALTALFQPIVSTAGEIAGYEGLIRGPSGSPLHAPLNLFRAAKEHGLMVEVEHLCRKVVLETFARLQLPGKLFLNVSPECLLQHNRRLGETLHYIRQSGIQPSRVIIELTENQPTYDYALLREAVKHYRSMGFEIAIDDLGEGFSSLRLWSELRPEYVKVDMHFIQGINNDPVKLHFVRSIQHIAENAGCRVVAEGVETRAELMMVKAIGIAFCQGYHIARPSANPALSPSDEVTGTLGRRCPARSAGGKTVPVARLLRAVQPVTPQTPNDAVYDLFIKNPELQVVPVVENDRPVGLINRYALMDGFVRPYRRELYGKKPCSRLMDKSPLVVEQDISVQELSRIVVEAERHHLVNGFIITDQGLYLGMGTAHDLIRVVTEMQINAARHANPLTLLPGNVPISEQVELLLNSGVEFLVCYGDLDHFKPFNDVYGYRKGDDLIQMTGKILAEACDPDRDFIGHVGGDDFVILFQSADWEARCRRALMHFEQSVRDFFSQEDRQRGGYVTEDRQGREVFHPLASLSLGVVGAEPGTFSSHHEIASAAAEAKKQAKRIPGNSLFVERRLRRTSDCSVS